MFLAIFFIFFNLGPILAHLGTTWHPRGNQGAPKSLQDDSKMPPRASESLQDAAKTLSRDAKKLHFPVFFNGFAFLGLLGAIFTQHGFLDASKSFQHASKSLQDASKSLQDASRRSQDAAKSLQDAAKTLPREVKKLHFPVFFQWFRIPGPS